MYVGLISYNEFCPSPTVTKLAFMYEGYISNNEERKKLPPPMLGHPWQKKIFSIFHIRMIYMKVLTSNNKENKIIAPTPLQRSCIFKISFLYCRKVDWKETVWNCLKIRSGTALNTAWILAEYCLGNIYGSG